MFIRKANLSDALAIADIEKTLQGKHAWNVTQIKQAYNNNHIILVADKLNSNLLIGYAICHYVLDEAELHIIGTNPHYQRLGVASGLLKTLVLSLAKLNVSKLFLEVRESNDAAIALYQKWGFTNIGIRKNYYQCHTGREDAILLCLALSAD